MNRIIETEMIGIRKEVCFGHVEYKLIYIVNRISIVKKKKDPSEERRDMGS